MPQLPRFYQDVAVDKTTLRELVTWPFVASAVNRQPLKYIISSTKENNALISRLCTGLHSQKPGPALPKAKGRQAILLSSAIKEIGASYGLDPGIAAQTILLGAVEKGSAGCMLGRGR